jgi:hypothetical protein
MCLTKKIKEILPSDWKKPERLGDILYYTVEEYLNWYKGLPTKPNKPFVKLFEHIQSLLPQPEVPEETPIQIDPTLEEISVEILDDYKEEYSPQIVSKLRKLFQIENLAQAAVLNKDQVDRIIKAKKTQLYGGIIKLIEDLHNQDIIQRFISDWRNRPQKRTFPQNINPNLPCITQLAMALAEVINEVSIKNPNRGDILKKYYIDGLSVDEIAQQKGTSHQNVDNHRLNSFEYLINSGEYIEDWLLVNPDLYKAAYEERDNLLYHPIEEFPDISSTGISQEPLLKFLGLKLFSDFSLHSSILIPRGKKARNGTDARFSSILSAFSHVLRSSCYPKKESELKDLFETEILDENIEQKEKIFPCLLRYHSGVESEGDLYWFKGELLFKRERLARIVYEANGNPVTHDELRERYQNLYGENPDPLVISYGRSLGIFAIGRTKSFRYGGALAPIRDVLAELIQSNNYEFHYSDIESVIKKKGYQYEKRYIRNLLMTLGCRPDLDDNDHFCHKDHLADHPQNRWKEERRYGITNALLNHLKKMFTKSNNYSVDYSAFVGACRDWCSNEGIRFNNTLYSISERYIDIQPPQPNSDNAKLFYRDKNQIYLNKEVSDQTDWQFVGKGGKYTAFSITAYGLTYEYLKNAEDKRILLKDLVKKLLSWANENMPDLGITDSAIRHYFEEGSLPDDLVKVTVHNIVYIKAAAHVNSYNQQYVVATNDTKQKEEKPITLVPADVSNRPEVTFSDSFTWDKLRAVMNRELSYYRKFFPEVLSNDTLDKFQEFISASTNNYLKNVIPQDLYEYWYARTNYAINYRYMSDLARWFEALLVDIYRRTKNKDPQTKGLSEICELGFPSLYGLIGPNNNNYSPIEKIFRDLHYKRNKEAHGEYLELSSANVAKCILDYLVLYIYAVFTFA